MAVVCSMHATRLSKCLLRAAKKRAGKTPGRRAIARFYGDCAMSQQSPVSLNRLDAPAEFKFSGDAGLFSGYASVAGNLDSQGDVVLPGAIKETVKTRDGKVLVLYQHSARDPIGKASVSQDQRGLHVDGQLMLNDPTAAKAYGLMKNGLLDAMSIGFSVLPGGETFKAGRRELSALKLFEVSIVTFGANDLARVDAVKSAMDCCDIRDLQDLLRARLVLSERKAKKAATLFWPIINGRDDTDSENNEQLAEQLEAFYKTLKGK